MKILQVHNRYKMRGGEDSVVEEERKLMRARGHQVIVYEKDNNDLTNFSNLSKFEALTQLGHSKKVAKDLAAIISEEGPEVCHVHNFIPLVTPAVFKVCKDLGVPVIHTLHNFRLICSNSLLYRDNQPCELCVGRSLYQGIKYKCYRNSYFQTLVLANMIESHRKKGTWREDVDLFLCLSDFAREKFVLGGIPENKIVVKPNFVSTSKLNQEPENFFLYVGRVERSKGVADLAEAASQLPGIKFYVIGDAGDIKLPILKNLIYLGKLDRSATLSWISRSRALIFPSCLYEGMPMTILEAFSLKRPVIARNHGMMIKMVSEDYGRKFNSTQQLIESVKELHDHPELSDQLGQQAYLNYLEEYSEDIGYQNLIRVYTLALESS